MDIKSIIYAAISIGGLGLVFGVGLGIAAKKFAIKVDPLIPEVRELLPGVNCGGCGYTGCDAFAKAIVSGEAVPTGCPVNNMENAEAISKLLGVEMNSDEKSIAYVKCNGTPENASNKYTYYGITSCKQAAFLQGQGEKSCEYGCLGYGECVDVCMFDAIHIVNGIAVVDESKCTACGMCVKACPKNLIELIPANSKVRVQCNSLANGKTTRATCKVGCISCRMCTKACEYDAIHVNDNLAKVNYDKCTECGACVEKCPVKCISTY